MDGGLFGYPQAQKVAVTQGPFTETSESDQGHARTHWNTVKKAVHAHSATNNMRKNARSNITLEIFNKYIKPAIKDASTSKFLSWIALYMVLALIIFWPWITGRPQDFGIDPERSSKVDGLYYWTTMTSTIGFGDICPKTPAAKLVTSLYQLGLIAISIGAGAIITDKKFMKFFKRE